MFGKTHPLFSLIKQDDGGDHSIIDKNYLIKKLEKSGFIHL